MKVPLRKIYKIRDEYKEQPWYNKDYYLFVRENIRTHYGNDCTYCNLTTGELVYNWSRVFNKITNDEIKAYWRNDFINNVLKNK